MLGNPKEFLIWWNNNFPLDRAYRKKYKIAFNSKEHQEVCQIDVVFDLLEDKVFEEYFEEYKEKRVSLNKYEKDGELFKADPEDDLERYNKFLPEDPSRIRLIEDDDSLQPQGLG